MSYLDELRAFTSQKDDGDALTKPTKPGSVSSVGAPSGRFLRDPREAFRLSDKGLSGLDPDKPLHGLSSVRWRQLLSDAQWLLDAFARSAFHDGWTVGELFGLWPDVDCAGGIADRLRGSRSLILADDRARWRSRPSVAGAGAGR
jgi:hypothetical protein